VGRESFVPLFLIFILLFVVTSRGFKLRGSILPRLPRCRPGGTLGPSPLPLYTQPFIVETVGLLLAASSGKVNSLPPWALHAYPRSCAKIKHACFEKQKLAQVDENEFEWTHPRAFDPSP
jgi:hypothetical protein